MSHVQETIAKFEATFESPKATCLGLFGQLCPRGVKKRERKWEAALVHGFGKRERAGHRSKFWD